MNLSKDKITLVVGLGASGLSTVNWLKRNDYPYIGWDDSLQIRDKLEAQNYTIASTIEAIDWQEVGLVILSPGIAYRYPKKTPIVLLAETFDIPITGDISLLFYALRERRSEISYIAITGTNGKSTTTSLVGDILKIAGKNYLLGGNIGIPVLDLVDDFTGNIVVLELSSYQLDLNIDGYFDIAALLNITPDHLDRHGGIEGYIQTKCKVFANQPNGSLAVIAVDDLFTSSLAKTLTLQHLITVSGKNSMESNFFCNDENLLVRTDEQNEPIFNFKNSKYLRGEHNFQNAAAAYVICKELAIADHDIFESFTSYSGLPHRQEPVLICSNMVFINDSKATNADATAPALNSFDNIVWILGGVEKSGGIQSLINGLERVQLAICYGQSGEEFSQTLSNGSKVKSFVVKTLEEAVDLAIDTCKDNRDKNFTVLLSPAAASFDQFKNFEHRGTVFKDYIHRQFKMGRI